MNRKRAVIVVLVVAAAGVVAWLTLGRRSANPRRIDASGTVEAREADLGFQVAGRIVSIDVHEGDAVNAGQVLAVLDTARLSAERAGAVAQLAAARAQLEELVRGSRPEQIAQAAAADSAAQQRLEDAQRDLRRARMLQAGGAVSQESLDKATTAYEVARAQKDQAAQQYRLVRTGPRREQIAAARAQVRRAQAAVEQLNAALDGGVIRAPFNGVITVRHREPGEVLAPGLPVLTLMNPADRWVRIYVREDRVGRVKLGEPAVITADAFPGRRFRGRVSFISSEAEFTPKNVQTTQERVKLVYAVKVAIVGDTARDLKPGVPADVVLSGAAAPATSGAAALPAAVKSAGGVVSR